MIPRNPSWSNMSPWEALLSWGSHCHLPLPRGCCLVSEVQPLCWIRESCQTAAWAQVERGKWRGVAAGAVGMKSCQFWGFQKRMSEAFCRKASWRRWHLR